MDYIFFRAGDMRTLSLMDPINLRYGAFITSTVSCPALHELQDGTLK